VYHDYLYYFSCTLCNTVDPVYYMNKTAAALKLPSYVLLMLAVRPSDMSIGADGVSPSGMRPWPWDA
jgi:hypothetical protein